MDLTIDDARALVNDETLWPRLRDFLWDFAPQIHPSWLPEIPLAGELASSPREKAWLLKTLGVTTGFFHTFPKDDFSRIALLDGALLLDLVRWLGVLHNAPALRRVTDGARVRALKAALPGAYPEAFPYTAYFRAEDTGAVAPAPEAVLADGMGILLAALKNAPVAVVDRLRKKLPRELSHVEEGKAPAPGEFARLLKLKFREAYSLCC